jgi:hypothetical protein
VQELQSLDLKPDGLELGGIEAQRRLPELERQLDSAIFDLYQFNAAERDLVREMCTVGLDLFYENQKSAALRGIDRPANSIGTISDVSHSEDGLSAYLRVFLEHWNGELSPEGEFVWRVLSPPSHAPLIAVSFATHFKNKPLPAIESEAGAWRDALARLEESPLVPVNGSNIFIDTYFRHISVNDREILFIKRDEQRFWTRSAARQDAESALAYLMNLEDVTRGGQV